MHRQFSHSKNADLIFKDLIQALKNDLFHKPHTNFFVDIDAAV